MKGATVANPPVAVISDISIHAPVKGATYKCSVEHLFVEISIHAPVKGATAKITKTIPNDFYKINNYNNSFA